MIQQIDIKGRSGRIYGLLYRPEKEVFPLVIISHGLGGSHEGSIDFCETFLKEGIGAFVFDFSGGSYQGRSEGKTTKMSVLTEANDLECVIDQLCAYPFIDPERIFLMGKSQGAFVSTIVAAKRKKQIKALIGLYPGYVLEEAAEKEAEKYEKIPEELDFLWLRVGRIYIEDLLKTRIYERMKDYEGDVLLIHGSADSIVNYGSVEKAARSFPHAQLVVLKGAEHGFHGLEREDVIKMVTGFLKDRI